MLGLIILLVVGVVAAALVISVLRFLFEIVVRLLLAVALAMSVGVLGGAIAAYNGYDGGLSGLAVGLVALIPSLVAFWRWRGTVAERLNGRAPVAAAVPLQQIPIERTLGLKDAENLATAWLDAENLAGRSILGEPREACAQFLAAFENAHDCDLQAIELATFIRRHVPGIVSDTKAVLYGADAVEGPEALAAMVTELQSLGHDAQEALSRRHLAARERLDIRRARFAARASEQGQSGSHLSSH